MSTSKQFIEVLREWSEVAISRSMHDWMRFVKASGLSMPQFTTLMKLYHHGHCGISDISTHLDVSTAAVSQMVDRLVQQGLLERTEDPQDRRAKQITLTPKSRALIERGIQARNHWMEELPTLLSRERQAAIIAALSELTEAAHNLAATQAP